MPESFALYASTYASLPPDKMRTLVDDVIPTISESPRATTFRYQWPDLEIAVNQMPELMLKEHLNGFEGYVRMRVFKGRVPPQAHRVIDRIRGVQLMVGVVVTPAVDSAGRAEELLGRMCGGLKPMIFTGDTIYDWDWKVLLKPDGTFE